MLSHIYFQQRAVRVFYRDKPPVGGIPIKEHFEINLAPLTIGEL
jgi:hypothetical protein